MARGYSRDNLPQIARFAGHLQRTAAVPPVEFTAPKLMEVTALEPEDNRIEDNRIVVHLVNFTAWGSNSQKMAPLANVGIHVRQGSVKRASLGLTGTELPIQDNSVIVPAVGYGEVVVLELE